MNRALLKRFAFASATCLLALPWLTPCTFGLGTMASGVINTVARPLAPRPLDYLPHPDLKQWAARPGPKLEVRTVSGLPPAVLVRDEEMPKRQARNAPRPGTGMVDRAGSFVGFVSALLAVSDLSTRGLLDKDGNTDLSILDDFPGKTTDNRRQLALSEFPFVLLQGEELRYIGDGKEAWPILARADKHSKVTIITPDGTFFGIARRIHFRKGSSELVLEGDPTVQSGEQHIKGAKPDIIMRLDFKKRRVTASGPVVEKKVFH